MRSRSHNAFREPTALMACHHDRCKRHAAPRREYPPLYASLIGVREAIGRLRDSDSVVPPKIAEHISER